MRTEPVSLSNDVSKQTEDRSHPSKLLKSTRGRCLVCGGDAPAEIWLEEALENSAADRVMISRTCAEHGKQTNCLSSDARFFWLSHGHPENAAAGTPAVSQFGPETGGGCCGSFRGCEAGATVSPPAAEPVEARPASSKGLPGSLGRNARLPRESAFETLSTCLALIEIVDSCNLRCPACYADSPHGVGNNLNYVPLETLQGRIQSAIDRKGGLEILQFSGGEPTLHPQFFELLEWAQCHEGIDYVLINTNGVRLAGDDAFLEGLRAAMEWKNLQLYLQFDGVQEAGQATLRGLDLRKTKERAIERAGDVGLPLTLAMTVTRENLGHLWDAVQFGLRYDHVRGICFQPLFTSGRQILDLAEWRSAATERLNTADIIVSVVEQSEGGLRYEDFTPLPCGDPNCATIGYLLKVSGAVRSISDFVDFSQVQEFLQDRVRYELEDLSRCGCESEPLGELLHEFEMDESHTFRLLVKPFMDAFTWDEDRIDRCCTHVIRPDGKLDSFCRYYALGGPAAHPAGAEA